MESVKTFRPNDFLYPDEGQDEGLEANGCFSLTDPDEHAEAINRRFLSPAVAAFLGEKTLIGADVKDARENAKAIESFTKPFQPKYGMFYDDIIRGTIDGHKIELVKFYHRGMATRGKDAPNYVDYKVLVDGQKTYLGRGKAEELFAKYETLLRNRAGQINQIIDYANTSLVDVSKTRAA
jgi:hypothetical protein